MVLAALEQNVKQHNQKVRLRTMERQARVKHYVIELEQFDSIRRQQAALLGGHMLLDRIPAATIQFLLNAYPLFLEYEQITAKKMAEMSGITPQAAVRHVHTLLEAGYLVRPHYRAWSLNTDLLKSMARKPSRGEMQ